MPEILYPWYQSRSRVRFPRVPLGGRLLDGMLRGRTQANVGPKTSLISKLRSLAAIHCKWIQDIGCVYTNLSQVVSTQSTCVLTRSACVLTQSASRVDTLNGSVDTSPRLQQTQLPDKVKCVDTVPGSVDTRPSSQNTSIAELGQCVDTLPGGVGTVHLKLKNTNFSRHEFLAAGGAGDPHTKPFCFPFSSAATCTNRPLEVDQRRRPFDRDGPIGRVLRSCRDRKPIAL
ncbi:hypothetical protein Taro_034972 [Colocasia esculenta]|uniref:Uncharacterized protein n=1 Tax=Colocasia esculenta TaxID=4460 RepID=A0A843W5D4_COLES|nr:hypothetical protein [Colocasia esculenta]